MRIRERHVNGAMIDWVIPDTNAWNISQMLEAWRESNHRYMEPTPPSVEPEKFPMGFSIVETESDTEVDQ